MCNDNTRDIDLVTFDNMPLQGASDSINVEKLLEQLSLEEQQDEKSSGSLDLFYDEMNVGRQREREREYNDPEKHWVRKKVWLTIAKELAEEARRRGKSFRYFTLPGFHSLDVGLFMRENLFEIDQNDSNSIYVAGFESDPSKYGLMAARTQKYKLLANCSVENALTDSSNDYYSKLQSLFPFDVVNMDLTTSLTPHHNGPYSTTMQAIEEVFRRQYDHSSKWALFLTFRNAHLDWAEETLEQLFQNLQSNIDSYPAVRDAFIQRHCKSNVAMLKNNDVMACISQAVVKWLIDRAHYYKIKLERYNCYQYLRYPEGLPTYTICKQVLVFSRGSFTTEIVPTKSVPREAWMDSNLVKCIEQHRPIDVERKLIEISESRPTVFEELRAEIEGLCLID